MKKEIINQHLSGERALFKSNDLHIISCLFDDGESPLKESSDLLIENTTFGYKYPLWYGKNHIVKNSTFLLMSRSGIWYTNDSLFEDIHFIAPKEFRRCNNISLKNVIFDDASETLWSCSKVNIENMKAKGDYLLKDCDSAIVSNLQLDGNYVFDGAKNITIKDSVLNSKDAFWNSENITIINCKIDGEYFGWNSKNIKIINSTISSHQGFCYIDNLVMENCIISSGDLLFEYCHNIDIDVSTSILESIKNPYSGIITCKDYKELILDDDNINKDKIKIIKKGE